MPLTERFIEAPLRYGPKDLYLESTKENLLKDVHEARMIGALSQLGQLARLSSEIFKGLFDEANHTFKRIESISERTNKLIEQLPIVEQKLESAPLCHMFLDQEKLSRSSQLTNESLQKFRILHETMPRAIQAKYSSENVNAPPNFQLVDAVMTPEERQDHGSCILKYSNPGFFFREWQKAEEERYNKMQEEKEKRKKEQKQNKNKTNKNKSEKKKKKEIAGWRDRFKNEDFGAEIVKSPQDISLVERSQYPIPSVDSTDNVEQAYEDGSYMSTDSFVPPMSTSEGLMPPLPPPPPLPPMPFTSNSTMSPPPLPPLPNSETPSSMPPPPPPPPLPQLSTPLTSLVPPPPPPPPMLQGIKPPVAGPNIAGPSTPPPPPPPSVPSLPKKDDLLSSIRTGKKLRPVEAAAPAQKPADQRGNLLAQIKQGNTLRHVERKDQTAEKPNQANLGAFASSEIEAILSRRRNIQDDSSDSDDSDSDNDWD